MDAGFRKDHVLLMSIRPELSGSVDRGRHSFTKVCISDFPRFRVCNRLRCRWTLHSAASHTLREHPGEDWMLSK